jgi:RimJ/RimL family protein N-acetyltransferase
MGEHGLQLPGWWPPIDGHHWLCEKIGLVPTFHLQVLTHRVNNEIVGAVGYDNWTGSCCDVHWAGSGWTPRFLAAAFYYPFVVENCKIMIARVPSNNIESAHLMGRLGFQRIVSICDGHPDGYMHIFMIRKENCKLLKRYYNA